MTDMMYCHACGKQIHTQATSCPACGAPQSAELTAQPGTSGSHMQATVACVLSVLSTVALLVSTHPKDQDGIGIAVFLAVAAITCGALSVQQKKPGYTTAVVAIVIAAMTLLFCLDSY